MRTNNILIRVIAIASLILNIVFFFQIEETGTVPTDSNSIHFIWNDDEESIPADGSWVKIEFTDENNVYLTPLQDSDVETCMAKDSIPF